MPRNKYPKGIFIKQNPPSMEVGPSKITTPVTGKPTIEELEEKQKTRQRLTLIERQTLLASEVKGKKQSTTAPTSGKQKEIDKEKQPIFESIGQPIFEQLEPQIGIETTETRAEEGHRSVILTPEQRLEYERQQREWRRQSEEEAKQENNRKGEEDRKRQEYGGDQETTFGFPIVDTSAILEEDVKMKNIPPFVLPNFYGMSTEDPDSFIFEFDNLCIYI